jgi:signal transduction histidine kinase
MIVLALLATSSVALLVRHVVAAGEQRQLEQRTREASVVLQSLVGNFDNPMRTVGVVLRGLGPEPAVFEELAGDHVGPDQVASSAALVRLPASLDAPIDVVVSTGEPLALTAGGAPRLRDLGPVNDQLTLVDRLNSRTGDRLGLLLGPPATPDDHAVYAELQFPVPGVTLRDEAVFSDLDYAVYLGGTPRARSMLFGTVDQPLDGDRVTMPVGVGNSTLLLEASARRPLTGSLASVLPWVVMAIGIVGVSMGAVAMESLGRRRDRAVHSARELAARSEELLDAQRQLAELNATLEAQVEHRTTELRAVNRELESFAYAVSHDLRAPLRAIDGFSLALVEDYGGRLDDTGRDYARRVRSATQRMGELIDDLLTLSRVTRAELHCEPVDLTAVARAVAAQLAEADPDRAVDIEVADGLTARGDPRLLRVALENLIGNAWKFTGDRPHPHIEIGARDEHGRRVFYVRDNGVGFDPDYADKLFAPFQRLHTSDEFEGNGIGLATVARVVNRHGGRVWADSAPNGGATFSFTCEPV